MNYSQGSDTEHRSVGQKSQVVKGVGGEIFDERLIFQHFLDLIFDRRIANTIPLLKDTKIDGVSVV